MDLEASYADSGGVSLAYAVVGDGPIPALGVTNWATNIEVLWQVDGWVDYMSRLSPTVRTIMYDQRGTGLSDRTGLGTLDDQLRDMSAVLDAEGVAQAVLFAPDMSAVLALAYAARHPDRVRALVLLNPVVHLPGLDDEEPHEAVDVMVDLLVGGWGKAGAPMNLLAMPGEEREHEREQVARVQRQAVSRSDLPELVRTWVAMDARACCADVRVPVLVVVNAGDQLVSPEQGRWIAAHVPQARLVELPSAEHFAFGGDRALVVAAVEEFLLGRSVAPLAQGRLVAAVLHDIVDSTGRAQRVGREAWHALLARWDALVREEVARTGGQVVNTAGDSHLVVHDSALAALRYAAAAGAAAGRCGLVLRTGVHVGEVDVQDGAATGLALHVVARVQSACPPGQVLVTGTVRDAVLGADVVLAPFGRRVLRGLPGRWPLWTVS